MVENQRVRDKLKEEFRKMFANADLAFTTLDFTGKGFISMADFLDCNIV